MNFPFAPLFVLAEFGVDKNQKFNLDMNFLFSISPILFNLILRRESQPYKIILSYLCILIFFQSFH